VSAFALAIVMLCAPAHASRGDQPAVLVPQILAAYDRATHADDVQTIETVGTIAGSGLTGAFHSWRDGENERDDESLGVRRETSLKLGSRLFVRDSSGNVRELRGYLKRRSLTGDFIDSGAFLKAPERSKFLGYGTVAGHRAWRLEVNAVGGEPQTMWIETDSGLPARLEYLDGDGPTTIDRSDWRDVAGHKIAFRSVVSDGERQFDQTEITTAVTIDKPIEATVFAPLVNRTLRADGVQTVPLVASGQHIAVKVAINDRIPSDYRPRCNYRPRCDRPAPPLVGLAPAAPPRRSPDGAPAPAPRGLWPVGADPWVDAAPGLPEPPGLVVRPGLPGLPGRAGLPGFENPDGLPPSSREPLPFREPLPLWELPPWPGLRVL